MTFHELRDFISRRMRMSHVYQPVMLKELLQNGGVCSESDIARALLHRDKSQVEYYEKIVLNMVGRVLRRHGILRRLPGEKRYLLNDFDRLGPEQIEELIKLCDERLDSFLQTRGDQPWSHRKKSSGYISGSIQYEVLKRARTRCEACGCTNDEKRLEVDHIVPRNKQGTDDISNLQALCYSCNARKRDRDDTDFRLVRESYAYRDSNCPFCSIANESIILENELAMVIADKFPVVEGHSLVIPKRHIASFFELWQPEVNACMSLLSELRSGMRNEDSRILSFNVGVNDGEDAGQTIPHCHWHLIPRRSGDVKNPRGGVRNVIPGMGDY